MAFVVIFFVLSSTHLFLDFNFPQDRLVNVSVFLSALFLSIILSNKAFHSIFIYLLLINNGRLKKKKRRSDMLESYARRRLYGFVCISTEKKLFSKESVLFFYIKKSIFPFFNERLSTIYLLLTQHRLNAFVRFLIYS